jgi:hypothetical protein
MNFHFHESPRRTQTDATNAIEGHKCSNPSLSNSNKATNAYGGIREEEQMRRITKNSKIYIHKVSLT